MIVFKEGVFAQCQQGCHSMHACPLTLTNEEQVIRMHCPCRGSQVNAAHVTRLDIIPDIDSGSLQITVLGSKSAANLPVHVDVYTLQNGTQVDAPLLPYLQVGMYRDC